MKDRLKKLTSFSDGLKCKKSQIDLHNVLGAKPLRLQSASSFKSLMRLNHVIEIHKPTQFPFTTMLQILEKKIAIPPFYQGTDNPFRLTFSCRTRNRSKPLITLFCIQQVNK